MMRKVFAGVLIISMVVVTVGCASGRRRPSSNRSGHYSGEAKPMNHRRLDSDSLYEACLRERTEVSCRNRLGR